MCATTLIYALVCPSKLVCATTLIYPLVCAPKLVGDLICAAKFVCALICAPKPVCALVCGKNAGVLQASEIFVFNKMSAMFGFQIQGKPLRDLDINRIVLKEAAIKSHAYSSFTLKKKYSKL